MSANGTLPPADDVDAFVYRMRSFVLKNEPTSFYRICGIVGRRVAHPAVRALISRQKDMFSIRDFQDQIRLSSNGTILNAEDTLMLWLNAVGEYHSDRDKEQVLRKIHELVLSRTENATLAIWGLAYKPNTHSVKNSPAL